VLIGCSSITVPRMRDDGGLTTNQKKNIHMKTLLLAITMAITGLGGLATSAQAHPFYHGGYHYGYRFHYGVGYNYCWHGGRYGYWNWYNGYRLFVVVPGPYWVCP